LAEGDDGDQKSADNWRQFASHHSA
jgi:hypothetical protein